MYKVTIVNVIYARYLQNYDCFIFKKYAIILVSSNINKVLITIWSAKSNTVFNVNLLVQ